ncbi:MAG: transposase [Solirubrobacterales bacterium]|nr:transposase [Solirubrobacterales bacterium]
MAALHRPLPSRHARSRRPAAAADGRRRDPQRLPRRRSRGGPPCALRGRQPAHQARPESRPDARRRRTGPARLLRIPGRALEQARSTNPLERINREIGRRSDVIGIFPNDAALLRLAGALLLEQNDEWLVGRRYLSQESLSAVMVRGTPHHQSEEGNDNPAQLQAA